VKVVSRSRVLPGIPAIARTYPSTGRLREAYPLHVRRTRERQPRDKGGASQLGRRRRCASLICCYEFLAFGLARPHMRDALKKFNDEAQQIVASFLETLPREPPPSSTTTRMMLG
jgi:hypothetical protein